MTQQLTNEQHNEVVKAVAARIVSENLSLANQLLALAHEQVESGRLFHFISDETARVVTADKEGSRIFEEVRKAVLAHGRLEGIRRYRELTGKYLKEAKDYVESNFQTELALHSADRGIDSPA